MVVSLFKLMLEKESRFTKLPCHRESPEQVNIKKGDIYEKY